MQKDDCVEKFITNPYFTKPEMKPLSFINFGCECSVSLVIFFSDLFLGATLHLWEEAGLRK